MLRKLPLKNIFSFRFEQLPHIYNGCHFNSAHIYVYVAFTTNMAHVTLYAFYMFVCTTLARIYTLISLFANKIVCLTNQVLL